MIANNDDSKKVNSTLSPVPPPPLERMISIDGNISNQPNCLFNFHISSHIHCYYRYFF